MTQNIAHREPWMAPTPGGRVAQARRERGWIQQQLADALTDVTDDEWSRFMVHNLETGAKVFDVETLMAVSYIQGKSYDYYLSNVDGYPGNASALADGDIPRYVNLKPADVIDIHTRQRVAK